MIRFMFLQKGTTVRPIPPPPREGGRPLRGPGHCRYYAYTKTARQLRREDFSQSRQHKAKRGTLRQRNNFRFQIGPREALYFDFLLFNSENEIFQVGKLSAQKGQYLHLTSILLSRPLRLAGELLANGGQYQVRTQDCSNTPKMS